MLVHPDLNTVLAIEHAEREATVVVGFHQFARSVIDVMVADLEVGTLHGDARAVVHHVA